MPRDDDKPFAGEDRRQDTRVYEILDELTNVAHDLQARSSTLVAMVDILQREVMRQDDEDAPDQERAAVLDTIKATAQEVLDTPAVTEPLREKLEEGEN